MLRPLSIALASTVVLAACVEEEPLPSWGDGPPPNVLLVSIDTLRADHLGHYGYPRPTSPRLDAFAAGAVVFENAQASSSWTLPGLASVFTSTYSSTHNCWSFGSRLDDSFTTLAEILTLAGYDSACVVSHLFCTVRHGLQQGFVHFDDTFAHPEIDPVEAVTSEEISDRGIRFLEQKAAAASSSDGRPWLLWLHYFDPHNDYVEHEGISERFVTPGERSADQIAVDRYDGEIAFTDLHIGRVLRTLEETGQDRDTIVVVFSDHGEEFGDHGGYLHGHTLYAELVRVPLLIRAPGIAPRRCAQLVRTVDVLPTVLDLIGLRPPAGIEGRSVRTAMEGRELRELPALVEVRTEVATLSAVVEGRYKLVRSLQEGAAPLLFDLEADPGETRDVADADPERVEEMSARLQGLVRAARERSADYDLAEDLDLPESVLDQLRGLGYVDTER